MFYLTLPYYLLAEYWLILMDKITFLVKRDVPENWNDGSAGKVLLLPGLHERWVGLGTVAKKLHKYGFVIQVIEELGYNTLPTIEAVAVCKRYILQNDFEDLVLIGHSKGGVIGRFLLQDDEVSARIKKLICIASPHRGSFLGFVFPSSKEVLPTSKLFAELEEQKGLEKILNLYPLFDNHVWPQNSLLLEGAKNVKVDVVGHTRILEDKRTCDAILGFIAAE